MRHGSQGKADISSEIQVWLLHSWGRLENKFAEQARKEEEQLHFGQSFTKASPSPWKQPGEKLMISTVTVSVDVWDLLNRRYSLEEQAAEVGSFPFLLFVYLRCYWFGVRLHRSLWIYEIVQWLWVNPCLPSLPKKRCLPTAVVDRRNDQKSFTLCSVSPGFHTWFHPEIRGNCH